MTSVFFVRKIFVESEVRNLFCPVLLCWVFLAVICSPGRTHASSDDSFIAGYATAVLEREFKVISSSLTVEQGVIYLSADSLKGSDITSIIEVLSKINGVMRVDLFKSEGAPGQAHAGSERFAKEDKADKPEQERLLSRPVILPREKLFQPLIADPRWPHFSVAYHYYLNNSELKNVGSTSFGESFALFGGDTSGGAKWQLEIQAGVFAVFDLDAASMDLINADYWVGFPLSFRKGPFSGIVRLFHQSSHLGDEFVLRNTEERVNLSYESIDAKVSYDVYEWLRLYAGGGFIFHKEPSGLSPWSVQYGLELKSKKVFSGVVRPVAGADFKNWQENNWHPDVSVRLGVQLESARTLSHRIQFMLEYFKGHSPHGQFYSREIEYIGIGTHFYF